MKKIIRFSLGIILILFCVVSCTKEEVGKELEESHAVGKLSFGSVLSDLANRNQLNKQTSSDSYDIPQCSNENPLFVRVAIKVKDESGNWVWYKNSHQDKIEIQVNPNGTDLDNDGNLDAWFTQESADLELEEGEYSIEYFAVATAAGNDEADIIYMAPRIPNGDLDYTQSIQYHNFVDNPLPIQVKIRPGVKYYQPVEVLCYEEHYAFAFGYLFFDFNTTNLIYLCTYGNVCDEDQRHMPAQFKMKVWKDSNEADLLVVAQNERKTFSDENGTHYYADALCFPLPEIEEYYAKIWLVEGETETLIREGSFDAEDLANVYQEEQQHYYYHFREACCDEAGNFDLLNDLTENEGECEEEPQDPEEPEDCVPCDNNEGGKIKELTVKYLGDDAINLVVTHNGPDSPYVIFNGVVNNNEEILLPGEATNGGHPIPSVWTELEFTISETSYNLHTSCSEPFYPGQIFGNNLFMVVSATNVDNQSICEIE
ncbi:MULTISPECIES: hypothetical protein [Salegentibacter]|uniref:Uncharacterized protein n=1 Tax=Salegentibacter agarivorans TaxID=345907 RepID=A0A1I2K4B6_9FLAO|nr:MULTISPECIES: hypothetical protein [Salegentibacter]SFF59901.1 hypothetical protein SAMN04488033_101283 [Salegentibacter agarivorans]